MTIMVCSFRWIHSPKQPQLASESPRISACPTTTTKTPNNTEAPLKLQEVHNPNNTKTPTNNSIQGKIWATKTSPHEGKS